MNKFLHYKKLYCPLCKYSLYYQTVIDKRQEVCHQLFSWTSVGPSKFLIDKMIGSQGHGTIQEVLWVPCVQSKKSITKIFFFKFFSKLGIIKKFVFFYVNLTSNLTISWSKASSLSPTVQLYVSWTLEIFHRQNHRFGRPPNSRNRSLTIIYLSRELFDKKLFRIE